MNLKQYIPILEWLPKYTNSQFNGDFSAGITIGVMLVPQGMAYAMLAGMPPIYGLYAATIPLIIYAIFGTSRQLSVGPVAMDSLLVASGVGQVAALGTEDFIQHAILLALMVGAIQLALGLFRLGFLVNFLSHPVISGFTSAAALVIGLNQLKYLLGVDILRSNQIHELLADTFQKIDQTDLPTLLLGTGSIILIIGLKRISKRIPGPLIAVVVGILIVYFFRLDQLGVKIVKDIPQGFPTPELPFFSLAAIKALLPTALTISLIGFMESIAVAKAMQAKHKNYVVVPNQELIALGMVNISASLFRAFPVAGGFSRTAVNDQAGAKTGMASIVSAILVVLTLIFLTPLLYYLPKAILAAVIMVAVFGLIDYKRVWHLWYTDKKELLMLIVTFVITLIIGIKEGILVGILLSLVVILYKSSYPHFAILGRIDDTDIYRNIKRFPEAQEIDGVMIFRFDAQLFFANLSIFQKVIAENVCCRKDLKMIVISAEAINAIDSSAVNMLNDLIGDMKKNGIQIVFAGVKGPVRDLMTKYGMLDKLGEDQFFDNISEALAHHKLIDRNYKRLRFQTDSSSH